MFAIPIITGLGYIGYELLGYFNYTKVLEYTKKKIYHDISDIDNIDKKTECTIEYILNLSKEDLTSWILNNIRSVDNIEINDISKKRLLKCLCFNIFFINYKNSNDEQKNVLNNILSQIENKINHIFKEDEDLKIKYYKFGKNEITSTLYKPMIIYSSLNFVKMYTYYQLQSNNFKKYVMKKTNITYFYYNNNHEKTIVFIHGLGFGSTPYLKFIMKLAKNNNVIIPILPNISNMELIGLFSEIKDSNLFPNYNEIIDDFYDMIIDHKLDKINLIGHSFGTIISSILMNSNKINTFIHKKILVDPVCFMESCQKIFKFIDNPYHGDSYLNKIFNALVYDDIYVKYATQRFLFGPKYWIYDHINILQNSLIVLSMEDKIVPSKEIYYHLSKKGIPCLQLINMDHGYIFIHNEEYIYDILINFINNI